MENLVIDTALGEKCLSEFQPSIIALADQRE